MYNNKYHAEYKHNGKNIIIDLAKLPELTERFEVIAMYGRTGIDFDCATFDTLEEAVKAYEEMLKKYSEDTPAPLTGKYAKLRDDLKKAVEVGKAADFGEDGGTCNFDSPSIELPRWIEAKVEQAAKEAGVGCSTWTLYGRKRYVFLPCTSGQANRRSRVSKAMRKSLEADGYSVFEYCQAD